MKSRNISKSIAQRGGLMIEALAMLGLIAVVTPTMYKKSAERTMEVEDINTASTIRTIMNAANDYVGANYSTIIADMGEGDSVRILPEGKITSYLPYGFDINKALYNYGAPQLAIAKKGNNLTTFALFETNTDIGQERTSRIASLIGSSGGYVTGTQKARGIGGIWKLEGDEYSQVFPDGADAAQYSIVTASADTISAATGNEIDMDKYLQRGRDNGDDPQTLWKNSMRTDLYMGGVDNTYDVYNNENHHPATETFSIRNIKSLIVGTDKVNEDPDNPSPYGLYIADGGKPDAFIHGSLIAAGEQFKADANRLGFGRNPDADTDDTQDFHFKVDKDGNATADGSLTNLMDVNLASKLKDDGSGPAWTDVKIGALGDSPHLGGSNYLIKGDHDHNQRGELSIINEQIAFFQMPRDGGNLGSDTDKSIVFMNGGYKKVNSKTTAADGSTSTASADVKAPQYNATQYFPVEVGSNMEVEGLLAAGQLDTQKIRAATLSVGSANIDDSKKWLTADQDGVKIQNTGDDNITAAIFQENLIAMETGRADANDESAGLALIHGNKTADSAAPAASVLYGGGIRAIMENKTLLIEGAENETRTLFNQGSVDLSNANFTIWANSWNDASGNNGNSNSNRHVFSVRANSNPSTSALHDPATSGTSFQDMDPYDIAMHGRVLIGNFDSGAKLGEAGTGYSVHHVSVGQYNKNAAVNIVPKSLDSENNDNYKNIVYIDQGATSTTNNYSDTVPGTVYIRKGYMEVRGETSKPDTTTGALEGKGVVAASRFVANNPAIDSGGNAVTDKTYGAEFPIIAKTDFGNYNGSNHNVAYDTYMVNPAYTSVMHDIKLTTRGGARLSDILPDFINKGIYVVNNTITEEAGSAFPFSSKTLETDKILFKTVKDMDDGNELPKNMSKDKAISWASPLLGVVPAPQCPPGYGRVITLTPSSLEMAQAGLLYKGESNRYFVNPAVPSVEQVKAASDSDERPAFDKVSIVVDKDNTTIPVTVGAEKGTADISNVKTSAYVLQAASSVQPAAPLLFQQSTRLKSMVKELVSEDNDEYAQGWAAIMGFLYSGNSYAAFKSDGYDIDTGSMYWNLFPVTRGTLEGYATVYCYFDRTNLYKGYGTDNKEKDYFIDGYTYMRDMTGATDYKKVDSTDGKYLKRLNDPTLKYNEAW